MDHELSVDPGDVDQDLFVLVLDHAPRVALVGHAVDDLDLRAARGQAVGEVGQPRAFSGGPTAAGAWPWLERDDVGHYDAGTSASACEARDRRDLSGFPE